MKKAIALRLNRKALLLIERLQNSSGLSVEIGPSSSSLRIDGREFPIDILQEGSGQLYENDHGSIQYVGDITHRASMKQTLSEEDKQRIRNRTEQAEREKNARRIVLLDHPPSGGKVQNSSKHATLASPTAPRHSINRTKPTISSSPLDFRSPTSITRPEPSPSATASLKERLIHLLALKPRAQSELLSMLKVAEGDLKPMLKQVAENGGRATNNWSLKLDQFKDIRIWEWSRYDDRERAKVRTSAAEAYDKLKLPSDAPERLNLIPQKTKTAPPTLVQPPSQRHPNTQDNAEPVPAPSSSSRKRVANNQEEQKLPKKQKPTKVKEETKDGSSSNGSSVGTPSSHNPAVTKPKRLPTEAIPTAPTKPLRAHGKQPAKNSAKGFADTPSRSPLTDDIESADDETEFFVESQADFDELRYRHDVAQTEYIRFKEKFCDSYPLFIKALTTTNVDESQRELFSQELLNVYLSVGGDMKTWQSIIRHTRKFNKSRLQLDHMWAALEKGVRDGLSVIHNQNHHRSPKSMLTM